MLRYSTYQSIHESIPAEPSRHKFNLEHLMSKVIYVRVAALVLLIAVTCTGMITAFASSSNHSGSTELPQVIVQPGDSLWSIASAHKTDDQDIRDVISSIKEVNQLPTSEIQAGDVLAIPVN
ncbi:LysM peptidoglycan-binding domain-containing protein [Paenibacillus sp. YPG26]|uniref:LysM peptidoglycan-binding domain-containing protein n=1 Tax=Paenibacillus sp. YPG26 TaxID=2878915 RepID=UPI00203D909B|nr:LysM peptidoglycan-binding domain-containing protein [Paenibacillus sp. YPG26]USB34891.1 LysM peptidoglycan-binding domain-containing protein [Paenibacillus sp. YPG26]